jgi:tetratricopeptide (TPR) repeat protein
MIHSAQAHFDQAEPLLKRALELQEQAIGPNHMQTAATLDELAGICVEQRKFKDAEGYIKRVIAIQEQFDPDENPDLAAVAERYAALLKKLDRTPEAEKWQTRAAAIKHNVEEKQERARAKRPDSRYQGFK